MTGKERKAEWLCNRIKEGSGLEREQDKERTADETRVSDGTRKEGGEEQ